VAGEKTARNPRFVTTSKGTAVLNEEALTRAKQLVGLKGYVTNIPITAMPGQEVIDAYHDLWNIEQSFRMSKHDLKARPIFHHQAEAIEAHLTIVFTALAIARQLQTTTGISIKRLIRTLRPLRQVTIQIAGQTITAQPHITPDTTAIIEKILGH
jgi:transposase DDE domain